MGIDTIINVISVDHEMKNFHVMPSLIFMPFTGFRLEFLIHRMVHLAREWVCCGICLMFMVTVAAEEYSAVANVWGHLQRAILAHLLTLDLYDVGSLQGCNSSFHRIVDERWPVCPVDVCASVFHTDEKTARLIKWSACEQVFYWAFAK